MAPNPAFDRGGVYAGSAFPRGSDHMYRRALDAPQWNPNNVLRLSQPGSDGNELGQFGAALAMNHNQRWPTTTANCARRS